jgi:hypothetical protein
VIRGYWGNHTPNLLGAGEVTFVAPDAPETLGNIVGWRIVAVGEQRVGGEAAYIHTHVSNMAPLP